MKKTISQQLKFVIPIFALILSISFHLMSIVSFAYDNDLFTFENTKTIAPNTTLKTIHKMTDVGWMQIHIISADISDKNVDATVLIPQFISQKKPLSELVKSEKNIIAGINGDFFDTTGQSTLGIVVKNGNYITSSIYDNRFSNYIKLKDGRSFITKINGSISKLNNGTASIELTFKNKPYLDYNRAIIFDRFWGETSIGNKVNQPVIELVITNDIIQDIRVDMSPTDIPENGYIVSAVGTAKDYIMANFKKGDKISISGQNFLTPIEDAIGGGSQIVKNGEIVKDFSLDISGRHPRSALGFSKDNKFLYLITVDGRHQHYTGMTQTELGYLMLEAGAYNAINLDGGGSSEMIAKSDDGQFYILNHPSDGNERPIHNGIGIINTAPIGKTATLEINTSQDKAFINMPITINYHAYDNNGHRLPINPNNINISIRGVTGDLTNNTFTATSAGTATITISYGNINTQKQIEILDNPVSITAKPRSIAMEKGESVTISLIGKDKNGFTAPISFDNIKSISTDNLGSFNENIFTATSEGSGYITLYTAKDEKNQAFVRIPIGIGSEYTTIYDFESDKGKLAVYPNTVSGVYRMMDFSYNDTQSGTLTYDFTNETATRAVYAKFDKNEIILPHNTTKLSLQVYGDYGQNHQLRAKFIDTSGNRHTIDFARYINWTGWKMVTATIPNGVHPAYLESIYIVETDPILQDKGVIAFDTLMASTKVQPPIIEKNNNYDITTITDGDGDFAIIPDWRKINDYTMENRTDNTLSANTNKVIFNSGVDVSVPNNIIKPVGDIIPSSSLNLKFNNDAISLAKTQQNEEDAYDHGDIVKKLLGINKGKIHDGNFVIDIAPQRLVYNKEKIIPIFLKNANAFLSRTNKNTGWQKILAYRDKTADMLGNKPIVIFLEEYAWFKNPHDTTLFYDTLNNLYKNGNKVILVYPDGRNSITKENGITHIRYHKKNGSKYVFDIDTEPISVYKVKNLNYIAVE